MAKGFGLKQAGRSAMRRNEAEGKNALDGNKSSATNALPYPGP